MSDEIKLEAVWDFQDGDNGPMRRAGDTFTASPEREAQLGDKVRRAGRRAAAASEPTDDSVADTSLIPEHGEGAPLEVIGNADPVRAPNVEREPVRTDRKAGGRR